MDDSNGLEKEIGYGVSLLNKIRVTSISFDNWFGMIRFICETGIKVETINMSIEAAQDMGILNLNHLLKVLPKPPKTSDKKYE